MNSLLIAGTDTNIGKTVATVALASYWCKYSADFNLGIFKLMQTGVGDWELYQRLFESIPNIEVAAPIRFTAPLAPPIAAAKENRSIDLGIVWQTLQNLQQQTDFLLIEALGGLGSPVTEELTVAHLASDWRLPTVLVVPVKSGAIAQTVANVALARSLNLDLRGIILNCLDLRKQALRDRDEGANSRDAEANLEDLTPIRLIQGLTQVPVLGTLPHVIDLEDKDKLASIASNWDLELILPAFFKA
jgi:dethiobiotin synthetase